MSLTTSPRFGSPRIAAAVQGTINADSGFAVPSGGQAHGAQSDCVGLAERGAVVVSNSGAESES